MRPSPPNPSCGKVQDTAAITKRSSGGEGLGEPSDFLELDSSVSVPPRSSGPRSITTQQSSPQGLPGAYSVPGVGFTDEEDGVDDDFHVDEQDSPSSNDNSGRSALRRLSPRTRELAESVHSTHIAEATLVEPDEEHVIDNKDEEDGAAPVVSAEPMRNKFVWSRRTVALAAAAALAVVLAIALGVAIPLSRRGDGAAPAPPAEDEDPDEILTYAPEAICYSHVPLLTDLSRVCTDPATLPKGGPFCQLVADAALDRSPPSVDVSLINAGGQRGDVTAGNVTRGDILRYLPFASNRVAYVDVTAAELGRTLEDGIAYAVQVVPLKISFSAGYPYASGLRYDVNLTAEYGARVSNVEIVGGSAGHQGGGWTALDLDDNSTMYKVVTNSYVAGGGDSYFQGVPDERKTITDLKFTEEFIEYCKGTDLLVGPSLQEMSTQNFTPFLQ